jgi:IclR family transcriptional regulator, acetate operon repressor
VPAVPEDRAGLCHTAAMGRPDDADERGRSGTQAVERALDILELFQYGPTEQGISEIARRVELRVPTAHRIVKALVARKFLERDDRTERYRLGTTTALLGQHALATRRLDIVRPLLDDLAEVTGESSALSVREGDTVLVVLKSASSKPLRFDHPLGDVIPVHASAMGKVMLAFSYGDVAEGVERLDQLTPMTARTITSKPVLVAELEVVRQRGWSANVEERYEGANGVAVPIFVGGDAGAGRPAWGAVGVHGPASRLSPDRFADAAARAQEVATTIGRKLIDRTS